MITLGSLFAGIGGLELGLGWALADAGIPHRVAWQVEREPYPRAILARHWPEADRSVVDVCTASRANLAPVDVICGGFPCQDLSFAGKGAGIAEGTRSGLWFEYARVVRELRPRIVVVENVGALLSRGLGIVLGDLVALGYDAEWHCVRASDVGAPHRRERLFIVAHAHDLGRHLGPGDGSDRGGLAEPAHGGAVADSDHARLEGWGGPEPERGHERATWASGPARPVDVADSDGGRLQERAQLHRDEAQDPAHGRSCGGHADGRGQSAGHGGGAQSCMGGASHGLSARVDGDPRRWPAGPGEAQHDWEAPRVAKGVRDRAARLKALGNAVVPQVAREIGRTMVVPLLREIA